MTDPAASGVRVVVGADARGRCWWCGEDPDYVAYHDTEWGRTTRDERELYELLCLEGFQAGLAWITILRKRPAFRDAFAGFDPATVAGYGAADVERFLADAGIVRHRGKIEATIANARATLDLHGDGGSLAELVWSHAPAPRPRRLGPGEEVPARTPESEVLSRELKAHGFRFVGPTTVYAFMQSAGLVDDHLDGCWVAPPARR